MKIYFTTDNSVDGSLEQVCPFGELIHFKRKDGTEWTMPKNVGSNSCTNCPYCYGEGFQGFYGPNSKSWMMIPKSLSFDGLNYEEKEQEKLKLGRKQFRIVSEKDYIQCARHLDEKLINKNKKLKFKLWWWHHIGIKVNSYRYKIEKVYWDLRFKINDCFNKWFKRV